MALHVEYGCYSFVLSLLYFIITLVSLFQISRIVYYRHNIFHYQFGFLVYSFLWGTLRTTFWLFLPWDTMNELWLQGIGLFVQFGTFTFLGLFYTQLVHKPWKSYRNVAMIVYGTVNIIFFASFIATIILALKFGAQVESIQNAHAFFCASMFMILSVFLAVYGLKLMCLVDQNLKVPFLKSKATISVLTALLVIVFVSRSVKDALTGFEIGVLEFNDPVIESVPVQTFYFMLYFVWEIIPAAMVMILFWRIPGKKNVLPPQSPAVHQSYGSVSSSMSININNSSISFQELNPPSTITQPSGHTLNSPHYDSESENLPGSKPGSLSITTSSIPTFKTGNKPITGYSTRSLLLQAKGSPFDD